MSHSDPNWVYKTKEEGEQIPLFHFLETPEDLVNHPSHYGKGKVECLEYIEDFLTEEEYTGYLRGNIAKYLHRWRYKGKPLEDLCKAEFYLKRLIKVVEK